MADATDTKTTTNGGAFIEVVGDDQDDINSYTTKSSQEQITLCIIFNNLITEIFFPQPGIKYASRPLLHRIKSSISENVPLFRDASKNTVQHVLQWTRRGSPFRALFVIFVGTIILLAFTGLLVFMLFFVAATTNAILISLLVSLAAAGGFLALFFACVTAVYIGALSVAVLVISAVTVSAIVAVVVATGWIGFFFAVWLATRKSVSLAKHSLSMAGSVASAYSSARHARPTTESNKLSD